MSDLRMYAKSYADKLNRKKENNVMILPFGLDDPEYRYLLKEAIKEQLPTVVLENPPKRIWLVAGSGTILRTLHKIFPNTFFNIVQVGKPIWDDILEEITNKNGKPNYTLYKAPEKFWEKAKKQQPHQTEEKYDAKIMTIRIERSRTR